MVFHGKQEPLKVRAVLASLALLTAHSGWKAKLSNNEKCDEAGLLASSLVSTAQSLLISEGPSLSYLF